jgi:hypothetical protein
MVLLVRGSNTVERPRPIGRGGAGNMCMLTTTQSSRNQQLFTDHFQQNNQKKKRKCSNWSRHPARHNPKALVSLLISYNKSNTHLPPSCNSQQPTKFPQIRLIKLEFKDQLLHGKSVVTKPLQSRRDGAGAYDEFGVGDGQGDYGLEINEKKGKRYRYPINGKRRL